MCRYKRIIDWAVNEANPPQQSLQILGNVSCSSGCLVKDSESFIAMHEHFSIEHIYIHGKCYGGKVLRLKSIKEGCDIS